MAIRTRPVSAIEDCGRAPRNLVVFNNKKPSSDKSEDGKCSVIPPQFTDSSRSLPQQVGKIRKKLTLLTHCNGCTRQEVLTSPLQLPDRIQHGFGPRLAPTTVSLCSIRLLTFFRSQLFNYFIIL